MKNADELFREFREHSVSEFFRRNAAMLGYTGKIRSLTTIVHEGVTNSLDACEETGTLPDVLVEIKRVGEDPEHLKVVIEDNGPGIPEQFIPNVFGKMLAGTKLHRNQQQRGQQGIGVCGAVMFSQCTSGRPIVVFTSTGNGKIVCTDVMIDVDRNEGKIVGQKKSGGNWHGTKVELKVKDVSYMRSRYGPLNYLRMMAIANPHARITFVEPDGTKTIFERATEEVPKTPEPMPLHPWGVIADDLLLLSKHTKSRSLGSFLTELSRVTKQKVEEVRKLSNVGMNKKPSELTWEEAERIVSAFKQIKFMTPSTVGLRPIGKANIERGLQQILKPDFAHAVTRPPKVYRGGLPFAVECGIAYGGGAGKTIEKGESEVGELEVRMELIRFANRAPLIFDQGGCVITAAVRSIDWRRYGVDISTAPLTLFVNLISAYVPYTSAGKQSISEVPEIFEEIRGAIMEVARELRSFLLRKVRIKEGLERAGIFERYLPVVARKASRLAGFEEPDFKPLLKKMTSVENAEESAEES